MEKNKEEAHTGSYLEVNEEQLKKLKNSYRKALEEGKESFMFQNKELLTNYARYLIEYLETLKL